MKSRTTIAATGAVTPIGLTAMETGFYYRTGMPGMREAPILGYPGEAITMGVVNIFPNDLVGWQRAYALAKMALEDCLLPHRELLTTLRVAIAVCVDDYFGEAFPGTNSAALELQSALSRDAYDFFGASVSVSIHPSGPAGPGHLLKEWILELESGRVDLLILGGVHTDYELARIQGLAEAKRLFSSEHLDALIPGEGAAFVLMGLGHVVRRLGLPQLADVVSFGAGFENARPDNDESAFEAGGMTAAVYLASAPVRESGEVIGWQINDVSLETLRLYEWQSISIRSEDIWTKTLRVESPCQRLGYQGGATLPLFWVLAAEAFRRGWSSESLVMTLAGSDAGERAAVLLSNPASVG
jgi:3-oxoacyl-[acyl-carrier-protein] synthase I